MLSAMIIINIIQQFIIDIFNLFHIHINVSVT